LFDWAKTGHEKTLNQRVRPGLIIIVNRNTEKAHRALGSIDETTQHLLTSFQKSSRFKEMKKLWKVRGRSINTARDLIRCYYYDFRVISIPTYTTQPEVAAKIAEAVRSLYNEIRIMSDRVRKTRMRFNLDLDVSRFGACFKHAAEMLAKDYRRAIDLHEVSSGDSPLPKTFSEHLVQLMSNMAKARGLEKADKIGGESRLIQDLLPFIAACIVAQLPRLEPSSKSSFYLFCIL
jgi:hypothetical protein